MLVPGEGIRRKILKEGWLDSASLASFHHFVAENIGKHVFFSVSGWRDIFGWQIEIDVNWLVNNSQGQFEWWCPRTFDSPGAFNCAPKQHDYCVTLQNNNWTIYLFMSQSSNQVSGDQGHLVIPLFSRNVNIWSMTRSENYLWGVWGETNMHILVSIFSDASSVSRLPR